jgi:hypothetical protein
MVRPVFWLHRQDKWEEGLDVVQDIYCFIMDEPSPSPSTADRIKALSDGLKGKQDAGIFF